MKISARTAARVVTAISLCAAAADTFAADKIAAPCDRQCLIQTLDNYLAALVAHDPTRVPRDKSFKATLNGLPLKLGEDLWRTARAVEHRQYFADPSVGEVALFGVVREGDEVEPAMVRLKVAGGGITESETILSRGLGQLGPRGALPPLNPIFDQELPPAERVSREILAAVGNQYFDALVSHNGDAVPWDSTCNRLENYVQMTNDLAGGSPLGCQDGVTHYMYHIKEVPDRRVLILDPERGLAFMIVHLDRRAPDTDDPLYVARGRALAARIAPGTGTASAPAAVMPAPYHPTFLLLAELFKIRNGKIRDIQAALYTQEPHSPSGWN